MTPAERLRQLDALLPVFSSYWHPQPFREPRPAWCDALPALADELLALSDDEAARLNDDGAAALARLARHAPAVAEIAALAELPRHTTRPLPARDAFWDWEIPGRKRAQIEAFAAAAGPGGFGGNSGGEMGSGAGGSAGVLDWCGGKGHLGRLLALAWQVPVHSLDFDAALCAAGQDLAERAGVDQRFIHADALTVTGWPQAGQHAVALHACGELHRRLICEGVANGAPGLDIAPCCYYRGVDDHYQPLSGPRQLQLTRDDTRLAVTETVTAKARETRARDQSLAWKLGFDAWRRVVARDAGGDGGYRTFKPVPERWLRAPFADFMREMCLREGLPALPAAAAGEFEQAGWRRRHEVMRYSIVRHAFRRALEVWLALDLAVHLENAGYAVTLGTFCERTLTPRNLLVSARR